MVCYIRKFVIILGDIPVDVPSTKILGDVSPASPAGLTPVIDGQTKTDGHPTVIHRPRCAYSVGSVNNKGRLSQTTVVGYNSVNVTSNRTLKKWLSL